ncbi:MAG TPA: TIGR00730 family Rossman fold protein [Puia sp.]|nr:TIGR00730 family Rossman fold protein [Puia sp.]
MDQDGMHIESVAVFCGSNLGNNPVFAEQVKELGKLLAMLKIRLVYGGGHKGLMGILADAVLEQEGHIMGVIPQILVEAEQQHKGLSEIAVVPDMHTRKKMIYERCDAVIVLPGGFGTLDELFEILTWNQLRIHDKKIYILNSAGYYNHLQKHIALMQKEGFLHEQQIEKILFCNSPVEIFNRIS